MNTEVPPPDSEEPPSWADDQRARKETHLWDNERKLRDAKTAADVMWAKAYGIAAIVFLAVFSMLFLGSLVSWSWHYITPAQWHWLSAQQLTQIQSVIFSSSLGGVIALVAQRQLTK